MQGYFETAQRERVPRTPEQRRRNMRVGIIAAAVALLIMVGSAIYIAYWGGTNKGPMKPFHSTLDLHASHTSGKG